MFAAVRMMTIMILTFAGDVDTRTFTFIFTIGENLSDLLINGNLDWTSVAGRQPASGGWEPEDTMPSVGPLSSASDNCCQAGMQALC